MKTTHEAIHIVSVSGGKDSTVLYCWAIDQFGSNGFKAVFADTGHEHPVTYNYLRNLPAMAGGPDIHWVKAEISAWHKGERLTDPKILWESIESGIPLLKQFCESDEDIMELFHALNTFNLLLAKYGLQKEGNP